MNISRISVDGLKGLRFDIPITSKNVLFTGPVGSGKSTLLEAAHLVLGLPTRHGSTGLDVLSPTGEWMARLDFGDGDVRRLERGINRRGSRFAVNGAKVDRVEYESAVQKILDVDPHHVSLGEFVGLSGQKRAALFSGMLESSPIGLNDMIMTAEGISFDAWIGRSVDDAEAAKREPWAELAGLVAKPAEMVEAVREAVNAASCAERDAKIHLEKLMQQSAGSSHSTTPAEARIAKQKVDEEIGALKSRRDGADLEKQRYESAKALVSQADQDWRRDISSFTKAHELAALRPEREAAASTTDAAYAALREAARVAAADLAAMNDQAKELAVATGRLIQCRDTCDEVMAQNWDVDGAWLTEEVMSMLDAIGVAPPASQSIHAARPSIIQFVQEVVAEVLGGNREKISHKIAAAEAAEKDLALKIASIKASADFTNASLRDAETAAVAAKNALGASIDAAAKAAGLTTKIAASEASLTQMRQDLERSSPREVDAALESQLERLTLEQRRLDEMIRDMESLLASSGQVERQRVVVAQAGQDAACMKRLLELVQRVRDDHVRGAIARVLGPFQERVKRLFGEGAAFAHHSQGDGRATEFYFTVTRPKRSHPVRLELLSDGESILAAAAFLSALQSIKDGPGSLLTLNSEGLDSPCLTTLLGAGPSLGVDHLFVANNRVAEEHLSAAASGGWQVVDLGIK